MNFNEHFLSYDIPAARLAFYNIVTNLKLIYSYLEKDDFTNAERITKHLIDALSDLNDLAVRKDNSQRMYLHHLLNKPQGWYPD